MVTQPNGSLSRLLLGLLAVVISTESARSSTKDLQTAIFQTIPWEETSPDLDQRSNMARAILAYWTDFSSRIPRPSPAEVEWIETEISMQGERLERAINSPEYAIYQLSRRVDMCIRDVNSVIKAQAAPESNQFEMFYWLKLVNCYSDSDVIIYLRTAGLSDGTYDGSFAMAGSSLILQRIVNTVIPTAMAETMGWTLEN